MEKKDLRDLIIKITGRKVSIFENKYVPVERKQGRKTKGTGITKDVIVISFARTKDCRVPQEARQKLSELEIKKIETSLREAHEQDIKPVFCEEFRQKLRLLHADISQIHLLDVTEKDISMISSLLKEVKKQQKKK